MNLLLCALLGLCAAGATATDGLLIIFVGFPKSGTTSYTEYFSKQLNIKTAHYMRWTDTGEGCHFTSTMIPAVRLRTGAVWPVTKAHERMCLFGELVQLAMAEKRKPFFYLHGKMGFRVFTQYDCDQCGIYPQLDALEEIMLSYPNAYFVHNTRNIESHVRSIMRWGNFTGMLHAVGKLTSYPGQHPSNSVEENVKYLLEYSRNLVRDKFSISSHLRFIEIALEEGSAGLERLIRFVNITSNAPITLEVKNVNEKNP